MFSFLGSAALQIGKWMYLSNSQFGEHQKKIEQKAQKAVHSKRQKYITAHHVMNIDDSLKFAKLMQMLSTPTKHV
jgi:hypothetical protein